MHPTVRDRLEMRRRARALGDVSLERACNADLARFGHRDEGLETTQAEVLPERAVPPKPRRGRPPGPRCEHGKTAGRCGECGGENGSVA